MISEEVMADLAQCCGTDAVPQQVADLYRQARLAADRQSCGPFSLPFLAVICAVAKGVRETELKEPDFLRDDTPKKKKASREMPVTADT